MSDDDSYENDVWVPSDERCPTCAEPTLTRGWWDDAPENGGACIGTLHRCTKCDWYDRR